MPGVLRMSRTHAALGIRQDTDIAVRCKLRALPATPRACSRLVGDALQRPLWMWLGGLAGVIYITLALILTPRLGASTFIVCVVAGQMLASLLIDHYGLMGLAQRLATPGRIAGVALIFAGMIVVQWQTPTPRVPAATGDAAAAQPEPQR